MISAMPTGVGEDHAQHMGRCDLFRPGRDPGQALRRDGAAGHHLPPGAPQGRGQDPVPPGLHARRGGSPVLRHRQGLRAAHRRHGGADRRGPGRPAAGDRAPDRGAALRARPPRSSRSTRTRATTPSPSRRAPGPTCCSATPCEASGKVAVAKVALRQREALAALRVREGVITLETLLWPDEVRKPDFAFLDEDIEVRSQELKMAASLIDTMTEDFEPDQYHDALPRGARGRRPGQDRGQQRRPPGRPGPARGQEAARRPDRDPAGQRGGGQGRPRQVRRRRQGRGQGRQGRAPGPAAKRPSRRGRQR